MKIKRKLEFSPYEALSWLRHGSFPVFRKFFGVWGGTFSPFLPPATPLLYSTKKICCTLLYCTQCTVLQSRLWETSHNVSRLVCAQRNQLCTRHYDFVLHMYRLYSTYVMHRLYIRTTGTSNGKLSNEKICFSHLRLAGQL